MKFFNLLSSFTMILLLNNLSCSESNNEPLRKKLKVKSSYRLNTNVNNISSGLYVNNEWHDLLANKDFNHLSILIKKLVKENHKELGENEKAQNDRILKETKVLRLKSLIYYKPDCRNDFQTYLKGILDADAEFKYLFKKKKCCINAIKNEKLFKKKGSKFEYISCFLSFLIRSIDTNKNKNLLEVNVIHSSLVLMNKRVKALRELLDGYCILIKNNGKLYDSDLNYFKLRSNFILMKELTSNEQNWDFQAINRSMMFKHGVHRFFAEFYECVEKENKLYCLIFDEIDNLISDFAAFDELKNNLIRNFDLD